MRDERLDSAFEVLARDEINGVDAIRQQAEEQAPIDADPMAYDARTGLQPDGADKGGGLSSGQAAQHRHGARRDVTRRIVQPLPKIS